MNILNKRKKNNNKNSKKKGKPEKKQTKNQITLKVRRSQKNIEKQPLVINFFNKVSRKKKRRLNANKTQIECVKNATLILPVEMQKNKTPCV